MSDPTDLRSWPLNQTVIPTLICPSTPRRGESIGAATGRRIETCATDLRSLEGCERVAGSLDEHFGRLDILVNNAGATQGGPFLDLVMDLPEHIA